MYVPKHYSETRVEVLHEFIRANPLGALVTLTPSGLDANHIPFEIDPEPFPFGTLRGHIARANPLWRDVSQNTEALVIFSGPSAYVSPSWYPRKRETGKVVPTWLYAVVHAHGPLRIIDDKTWLRDFVETLTNRHEAGRYEPWKVSDAPADYIDRSISAIVGIEMPVTRLIGKWKVNQQRSAKDHAGVIEGLLQEGHASAAAMASLVRESRSA
jgi:transcriptional regulator